MSDDLMQSTIEEQAFWCNCVRGMPGLEGFSGTGYDKFGERIAWGTGSHSLHAFREAFKIVNPKHVFEIGFNIGYASAVFLNLNECSVFSCDISLKDETIIGAEMLTKKYKGRFQYINRNDAAFETELCKNYYDLAFVDGNHLKDGVKEDILLCLQMSVKYLLFDDVLPQFGNVQEVIDSIHELELVEQFGNIALYKNTAV